jgi:hippurate hydrolase
MRGTIRTLRPETHDHLAKLFRQVVEGTAAAHGVRLELEHNYSYPPTINTPSQAALAAEAATDVVGAARIKADLPSLTAGEDFAYMLQETPGAFILLGQAGESETSRTPVHNGRYDFNDDLLPIGASCLVRLVERELTGA